MATIGPATDTDEAIDALIDAGVDVVRVGLAHGTPAQHAAHIDRVRRRAEKAGRFVAVLIDLPGPKIRIAPTAEGGFSLAPDDVVALVVADTSGPGALGVASPDLIDPLEVGDLVSIGDGNITLAVCERTADGTVKATVLTGGRIMGQPGLHLPSQRIGLRAPTAEDIDLIATFGDRVDFVAVSFVRSADEVDTVRRALPAGATAGVIAKIETTAAVDNLDGILRACDGVMVARGDLGLDLPIADLPHLQKMIIRRSIEAGRPVITATQMLESMVTSAMPTRAEVTDVANAVFDGTDAVMLSGETAVGNHPVHVVKTMAQLVERAETEADYLQWGGRIGRLQRQGQLDAGQTIAGAITHAAWQAAVETDAASVICCTTTGGTARLMARFRIPCGVVAATAYPFVAYQLALAWGIRSIVVDRVFDNTDDLVWHAVEDSVQAGYLESGDTAVVVTGRPGPKPSHSDTVRIVALD